MSVLESRTEALNRTQSGAGSEALSGSSVSLRAPTINDGMAVYRLVAACPPLDTNSSYCNFLQAGHFSATSVAAEMEGELVGFVSGYRVPGRPDTLFVWQVAVSDKARGRGLASQMLAHLLERPACHGVRYLETTITEDNEASWSLFRRLAQTNAAKLSSSVWLDQQQHFGGQHPSELLVRIGPFNHPYS